MSAKLVGNLIFTNDVMLLLKTKSLLQIFIFNGSFYSESLIYRVIINICLICTCFFDNMYYRSFNTPLIKILC